VILKRPSSVTVIGILSIVFASLSLLGSLCNGISLIMQASGKTFAGGGSELELHRMMVAEIPGYVPFEFGSWILSLILGTLLLVSGIGLLNMRPWARTLSLLYAPIKIVFEIGALIYTVVLVTPVQARWMEAEFARKGVPAGNMASMFSGLTAAVLFVGAAITIGYAIVLMIVLMRPNVREAFGASLAPPLDEAAQDEGDEYERKRKEPWDY
jgi:hypothetical protein